MGGTTWRPLLSGALAVQAREAVLAIAEALENVPGDGPSLADGAAGRALFFSYLETAFPRCGHEAHAERALDDAVTALAEVPLGPDLYSGFSGVAFAAVHLRARAAPEDEDANEEVDAALLGFLDRSPWTGPFDLVSGLAGIGVYALERLPRPSGREMLGRIVSRLEEASERQPAGVAWRTRPAHMSPERRVQFPEGQLDLGVAHGTPAVIAVLAGACGAGIAAETAHGLLERALSWQWACERSAADAPEGSRFAYRVGEGIGDEPARAAWCYGDPGVAATLHAAALAVGDRSGAARALALGRAAAACSEAHSGVRDAGVCHGAAGLMHLFNRLWHASGDEALADAARRWAAHTLAHRGEVGPAGFRAWGAPAGASEPSWRDDCSLLTGVAGIGLCLLAAMSSVEPSWDRFLLASLPGGA